MFIYENKHNNYGCRNSLTPPTSAPIKWVKTKIMELKGALRSYKMYGFIYKIENLINKKVYVGQSVDVKERQQEHFRSLKKNKHQNRHLQFSFNKYGESNFNFTVLTWANSKEELDKLEIYFIKKYDSINMNNGYNLRTGGSRGKHSIEVCKKLSLITKERYKNPENNPFYGKKHSAETKEKISQNKKGRGVGKNNPMYNKKRSWHGFQGTWYSSKNQNPWTKVWQSSIQYNYKQRHLGMFNDPLSAEIVYKIVFNEIYGLAVKSEKYCNKKEEDDMNEI